MTAVDFFPERWIAALGEATLEFILQKRLFASFRLACIVNLRQQI